MEPQHDQPLFGVNSWIPSAFRLPLPSNEEHAETMMPQSPLPPNASKPGTPKTPKPPRNPSYRTSVHDTSPPQSKTPAAEREVPAPKPPSPKPAAKPVSTALALPVDYIIRDLGIKDVDLVLGGKDPTSGAVVAFPVRRMNIISASSVMADMLQTKPPPFGAGPDSIKTLPYLKLDENALLMERILPFMFNDLDLPKTTDIHFVRAVYQAAHKYKMRRLFDWMTEKLRAGWSSAAPETALNLYAVVKKAEDPDLATIILNGLLEQYTWSINREAENKWTCESGAGPKVMKDCTDAHGLEILLAIANRRLCMTCKNGPFVEPKPPKEKEEPKPTT